MKSTRQSKKFLSRAISFAVCLALVLCVAFSLGFVSPPKTFADDTDVPAEKVKSGTRFVQVAAGADFAIGLTYDNDLYGWSLTRTDNGGINTSATTLGGYYPAIPTKINVVFRIGPGTGGTNRWTGNGSVDYHREKTPAAGSTEPASRIKQIAATRTTAAFVTTDGYLYTWGFDGTKTGNRENVYLQETSNRPQYLLLRDETKGNFVEPYIINYNYYNVNDGPDDNALKHLIPGSGLSNVQLVASEYNYSFLFTKNTETYLFTWGSLIYSASNTAVVQDGYNYWSSFAPSSSGGGNSVHMQGGNQARRSVKVTLPVTLVAGGYTVGINGAANNTSVTNSTSLLLRGKNFVTSKTPAVTESTTNITVTNTTSVVTSSDIKYTTVASGSETDYTVGGAIAGGKGSVSDNPDATGATYSVTLENYFGRQTNGGVAGGPTVYALREGVDTVVSVSDGNGKVFANSGSTTTYNTGYRSAVSLGNDIGYGISGGALFGWGDNASHQLTNAVGEDNSVNPTLLLSSYGEMISVAAGKQLSPDEKAFNGKDSYDVATGKWKAKTEGGDLIANGTDFISGAINVDGKLIVWSNNNGGTPAALTYAYGADTPADYSINETDKFVAVYSGYGNNLFAITALGKLVRVTYGEGGYNMIRYDVFRNVDGTTTVNNWSVDSSNRVSFAPTANPEKGNFAPAFVPATFYVWSAPTASETDKTSGNVNVAYKPLVGVNNTGDAYRILDPARDNDMLSSTGTRKFLMGGTEGVESFAPVFKFDGVVMTEKQRENMFDVAFVNDANGVGITISPKQSSKGQQITVEFYVGRFNAYSNFFVTDGEFNSSGSDKAVYYDYKKCSFTFDIKDTPSVVHFIAYEGASGEGNSNIPLLDPNNDNNKNYSVAVQNASKGFDELINFLTGKAVNTAVAADNEFKTAIIAQANSKDAGFPRSTKIGAGHLDYYLGETTARDKYNDVYQFLYEDRDADKVVISDVNGLSVVGRLGANNVITAVKHTVNAVVAIDEETGSFGILSKYLDMSTEDLNLTIKTDFDNKYGLYDIVFSDDKSELSFKYDIVTFTANGSTGNIAYGATDDESATRSVSDYRTVNESAHLDLAVRASTITKYDSTYAPLNATGDTEVVEDTSGDGYMAGLFSQATVRFKDDDSYYGYEQDGENNRRVITRSEPLYVGNSVTINISDFVNGTGNGTTASGTTNIYFSHNNRRTASAYDEFNKQFVDTTESGVNIIALNSVGTQITVTPTVGNLNGSSDYMISFDVAIQRFADGRGTPFAHKFGENDCYDEKLYLTFNFTNIIGFTFEQTTNAPSTFTIRKAEEINLFGGTAAGARYNAFAVINGIDGDATAKANIQKLISIPAASIVDSGDGVFDITQVSGSPALTITPIASGTGTVQFTATVYGQSVSVAFTVHVAYVTVLTDSAGTTGERNTISLVNDEYVYINELFTKLKENNKYLGSDIDSYKVLYNDVKEAADAAGKKMYNAVYFTREPLAKVDDGYPAFIKSVTFEGIDTRPYIRIEPSTSTVSSSGTYYMHVRFTNSSADNYASAEEGSILEIVVPIVSGKVIVNLSGDDVINVNIKTARAPDSKIWYTQGSGTDTVAYIKAKDLLDAVVDESGNHLEDTNGYEIFLVTASTEATQYFNYRFNKNNEVEIEPLYNTPDGTPFAINLSVYNRNRSDSKVLTFDVSVSGILTTLPVVSDGDVIGYGEIWLYSFIIVFGVLAIIFIIRIIVYWRKRASQRAIIKRNQELIRLRDRMHNKATAASREQIVRTKLKMEDPKYAKIFNDMRKDKEDESGITLENSDLAATADAKVNKKKKKKKGGKKTVAELKAELEAKRAAFASAQQNAQPVNPYEEGVPMDGADFVAPDGGFGGDGTFGGDGADFVTPEAGFDGQNIVDGGEIIFDANDMGDGM